MFLRFGFSTVPWMPAANRLIDNDGAPVTAVYVGGRLDPQKGNLDLKSGETTR
jgi:hypothetical protein